MQYNIKILNKNYLGKFFAFWKDIFQNHYETSRFKHFPEKKKDEILENYSSNNLLKKINDNNTFIYIIEDNDKIIGTISLLQDKNVITGYDFLILHEYQAKKYDELFVKKVITDVINMPYESIEIIIDPDDNRTISLLNKFGFFYRTETSGIMRNYLPLIYKTQEAHEFFRKNDWYDSFKSNIILEPDILIENNKKNINYNWTNNNETLKVEIDAEKNKIINIDYKKTDKLKFNKIEFEKFTGKNIKIGIIDSGVDSSHPYIGEVKGGVNIFLDSNNNLIKNNDYSDNVGHGTACAGIIKKKARDVLIYSIKVFQDTSLSCNLQVLLEGIKWAIENNMNIINLSLGTTGNKNICELYDVCEYAKNKGIIIVAADNNEYITSYPSVFLNVIGVTGGKITGKYIYHFNSKSSVPFIARGDRQRLAWVKNDFIFLGGTSFASPHISAITSLILEANPGISFNEAYEHLINNSKTEAVEIIKDKSLYYDQKLAVNKSIEPENNTDKIEIMDKIMDKKFKWIKRACIYPFNKEMHALVRARDLLDFEITAIADPIGKGLVGKDAGEAIGIKKTGITIEHNLKNALAKSDTLILSHVNELGQLSRKDIFKDSILKAIELNKNIFLLDSVNYVKYTDIFKLAEEKKLIIDFPKLEEVDFQTAWENRDNQITLPVVGVFGTSPQQGKFTAQLALRRLLLKEGYKLVQIGTEPHSELFGFDLAFPIGYESIITWPERASIIYLHNKIFSLIENKKPDIVVVGCQAGIIPINLNYYQNHTLQSVTFLFATKPDAYILCVNTIDDLSFIWDSINSLHGLGKGKTILLVLSDQEKIIKNVYGKSFVQTKKMSNDELRNHLKKLEKEFSIPATEVISEEGQKKMFNTVIDFFSKN